MKAVFTRRPIDLPRQCIRVLLKENAKGGVAAMIMSQGGNYYKPANEFEVPQALETALALSKECGVPFFVDTAGVEWDDAWGELSDYFNERK